MAKPPTTHVIAIETGVGDPTSVPISTGEELPPLSIGPLGMWHVEAEGLLDVHAFVYFDGDVLFLRAAEKGARALVEGTEVGTTWVALRAPCWITLGGARLRFRTIADEQKKEPVASAPVADRPRESPLPAMPLTFPKTDRPFSPGAFSNGPPKGDSRRLAPAPAEPRVAMPNRAEPTPRMPRSVPAPRLAPDPHGSSRGLPRGDRPASVTAPIPGRPRRGWSSGLYEKLARRTYVFVATAMFCLSIAGYLMVARDRDERDAAATPPVASTQAPAQVQAPPQPQQVQQVQAPPPPQPQQVQQVPPSPQVQQVQQVPSPQPQPQAPVAQLAVTAVAAPVVASDPAMTLERQAADQVALGNYGAAAAKYDELHQRSPNNRVYPEAARILRLKIAEGR